MDPGDQTLSRCTHLIFKGLHLFRFVAISDSFRLVAIHFAILRFVSKKADGVEGYRTKRIGLAHAAIISGRGKRIRANCQNDCLLGFQAKKILFAAPNPGAVIWSASGAIKMVRRRSQTRMRDPVLDMLGRLRERPALYIGSDSGEALFMFLCGYTAALRDHTALDVSQYRAFIDGLYAKYGRGGGGHSWAAVLSREAGGDTEALSLFFAELASFQERHAQQNGAAADRPRD
jgi:hypothetical protein